MVCTVLSGDCLEQLAKLEPESVDAIVTDPPYGLSNTKPAQVADVLKAWVTGDTKVVPAGKGFMGKDWDSFVPPPAVWEECMRVLKPGGHMAVFAGARTQDLMGLSIRLAGFEIRDTLGWIYGSGFPKSHDIGKAIDKRPGVHHHREFAAHLKEKREAAGLSRQDVSERVVGTRSGACWNWEHHQFPKYEWWPALRDLLDLDEGRWGQIVAEADREVVGVRNDGASSIYSMSESKMESNIVNVTAPASDAAKRWEGWGTALKPAIEPIILARKPLDGTVAANVLAHGTGGLNIDACRVGTTVETWPKSRMYGGNPSEVAFTKTSGDAVSAQPTGAAPAGRFPANVLLDEHAATILDEQSGGHADSGGASRFFYVAKAPKRERPNIDGAQHPTVKPLTLMLWLVRLVTPPNGVVCDPFAGSGTTIEAAILEGFNVIGIEREADYLPLIDARIERAGLLVSQAEPSAA